MKLHGHCHFLVHFLFECIQVVFNKFPCVRVILRKAPDAGGILQLIRSNEIGNDAGHSALNSLGLLHRYTDVSSWNVGNPVAELRMIHVLDHCHTLVGGAEQIGLTGRGTCLLGILPVKRSVGYPGLSIEFCRHNQHWLVPLRDVFWHRITHWVGHYLAGSSHEHNALCAIEAHLATDGTTPAVSADVHFFGESQLIFFWIET
mmetsp:Transcript_278/g.2242  ORF Transcript_278/g.2242 Transcript_278/m.2242 type:complete len:203 (+) Transcript_278:1726-2334(+)